MGNNKKGEKYYEIRGKNAELCTQPNLGRISRISTRNQEKSVLGKKEWHVQRPADGTVLF